MREAVTRERAHKTLHVKIETSMHHSSYECHEINDAKSHFAIADDTLGPRVRVVVGCLII